MTIEVSEEEGADDGDPDRTAKRLRRAEEARRSAGSLRRNGREDDVGKRDDEKCQAGASDHQPRNERPWIRAGSNAVSRKAGTDGADCEGKAAGGEDEPAVPQRERDGRTGEQEAADTEGDRGEAGSQRRVVLPGALRRVR